MKKSTRRHPPKRPHSLLILHTKKLETSSNDFETSPNIWRTYSQSQPGYDSAGNMLYPQLFESSGVITPTATVATTAGDVRPNQNVTTNDKFVRWNREQPLCSQLVAQMENIHLGVRSESDAFPGEYSPYEAHYSDQDGANDAIINDVRLFDETVDQQASYPVNGTACEECCGQPSPTTCEETDLATSKTRVDALGLLRRGDHVAWRRSAGAYWHHGIVEEVDDVTGRLLVINYNGEPVKRDGHYASVRREWVTRNKNLYRFEYAPDGCFPPDVVVARAMSRLGEAKYNPFTENCEHFARWCKTGQSRSSQVETLPKRIRNVPDGLTKRMSKEKALIAAAQTVDKSLRAGKRLAFKGTSAVFNRLRKPQDAIDC